MTDREMHRTGTDVYDAPTVFSHVTASEYDAFNMKLLLALECGHRLKIECEARKMPAYMYCDICTAQAREDAYHALL